MFKIPDEAQIPILLVDKNDQPVGQETKKNVHIKGLLHRAFSVFIQDDQGQILLQRRHEEKYHSGGLWTNACCGHPFPDGPDTKTQAMARLKIEMGIDAQLNYLGQFIYKHQFSPELYEHELDHVYSGHWAGDPINPHPDEVCDFAWFTVDEIKQWIDERPEDFTIWFLPAWKLFLSNY